MTILRKLQRDHVAADLAVVEVMINRLTEEDVVMRLSLEERREELRRELDELQVEPAVSASAALFFGGRPVVGTLGIESEFGGRVVSLFQDLVAKQYAHDAGVLGQRGVVPNKAAARLHITNVVRGSFGFLFEELDAQPPLINTELTNAVQKVSRLMAALAEDDAGQFEAVAEDIDQRVLSTASDFFGLLQRDEATFRVLSGEMDRSFDRGAIQRAAERAIATQVEDAEEQLDGTLTGVLPEGRMFEFQSGIRGVIRGKIDKDIPIPTEELTNYHRDWVNHRSIAIVAVRKVLRRGQTVRERFTLKNLRRPEANP